MCRYSCWCCGTSFGHTRVPSVFILFTSWLPAPSGMTQGCSLGWPVAKLRFYFFTLSKFSTTRVKASAYTGFPSLSLFTNSVLFCKKKYFRVHETWKKEIKLWIVRLLLDWIQKEHSSLGINQLPFVLVFCAKLLVALPFHELFYKSRSNFRFAC